MKTLRRVEVTYPTGHPWRGWFHDWYRGVNAIVESDDGRAHCVPIDQVVFVNAPGRAEVTLRVDRGIGSGAIVLRSRTDAIRAITEFVEAGYLTKD